MENTLSSRGKLLFQWIPENTNSLLDVGCASGYYTVHYSKKCSKVFGIDPNENLIKIAKEKYPNLDFRKGSAEEIPFKDNSFDVVILSDVLEHVADEKKCLSEIHRVLKDDGKLILTVPHKGLFSFLDVDNYSYFLRTKMYGLYKILYKIKKKKLPEEKPGYTQKHKHYSIKDIEKILTRFNVVDVTRRGLIIIPFVLNLRLLIRWCLGEKIELKLKKFLNKLIDFDYSNRYGRFSLYIAVYAHKN